jgi:hypothetical protein
LLLGDRWGAGRDPRARALQSARLLHRFRWSAAGRDTGPLRTCREPRKKRLKEEVPARHDACAATRAHHTLPLEHAACRAGTRLMYLPIDAP